MHIARFIAKFFLDKIRFIPHHNKRYLSTNITYGIKNIFHHGLAKQGM